ncbi:hypothetical protein H696_00424 [Fonticula alba]|uniref:Poly(A) polymerase n=1 Tax=Fonticula alba TaxID=691883 RepID=A0A058ZEQ2_FONAL|nr:hypothetical protein H696_00424 [Fonticula alba]KCV72849.1 hypothetical protein H696_00424 [Fonticula alba]|eukprot:XP_009492550.1 hypothetical protein H696_00424 [Fonticula alba]
MPRKADNVVLSSEGPAPRDLIRDEALDRTLKLAGYFESASEAEDKQNLLATLDQIVKKWVYDCMITQGYSQTLASRAGGKIYTLGSYRLGAHQRVPEARVPIIKMKFCGVEIDLLFAKLNFASIPDNFSLMDPRVDQEHDQNTLRSLNGPRVAQDLLANVPNAQNFCQALRAIKHWAQRRAIYSNPLCYVGGIALAIMVGRVAQLYPNASPSMLVHNFFRVYHMWNWKIPVIIKSIDYSKPLPQWAPPLPNRGPQPVMPIITPTYPVMNSTYNVTQSTYARMKEEIRRGVTILNRHDPSAVTKPAAGEPYAAADKALLADFDTKNLEELFDHTDFFTHYGLYLEIIVASRGDADHASWKGFVESRMRVLIHNLEKVPILKTAAPFNRAIPHTDPDAQRLAMLPCNPNDPNELKTMGEGPVSQMSSFFVGISLMSKAERKALASRTGDTQSLSLTEPCREFMVNLFEYQSRFQGLIARFRHYRQESLPEFVFESLGLGAPGRRRKKRRAADAGETTPETAADGAAGAETSSPDATSAGSAVPDSAATPDIEPEAKRQRVAS